MKFVWLGKLCFDKLTDICNVVAHNMEWEGCLMHITIYDVQTTL
jgi:hypothetical protein